MANWCENIVAFYLKSNYDNDRYNDFINYLEKEEFRKDNGDKKWRMIHWGTDKIFAVRSSEAIVVNDNNDEVVYFDAFSAWSPIDSLSLMITNEFSDIIEKMSLFYSEGGEGFYGGLIFKNDLIYEENYDLNEITKEHPEWMDNDVDKDLLIVSYDTFMEHLIQGFDESKSITYDEFIEIKTKEEENMKKMVQLLMGETIENEKNI